MQFPRGSFGGSSILIGEKDYRSHSFTNVLRVQTTKSDKGDERVSKNRGSLFPFPKQSSEPLRALDETEGFPVSANETNGPLEACATGTLRPRRPSRCGDFWGGGRAGSRRPARS